jgi:hypothetical protein
MEFANGATCLWRSWTERSPPIAWNEENSKNMRSPARRRLLSVIIAMALLFGAAMVSARVASLKWLALAIFSPGLKAGLLLFPGGSHGSNPGGYLKLSIFLSLVLWWVVVELVWTAVIRARTRRAL